MSCGLCIPISFALRRLRPGIQPKVEAPRALNEGKKIIVGRDKPHLDKAVEQKLLQDHPKWIQNIVLIQELKPAVSDTPKLERQVSELVAHINGEYFIPVQH